MTPRIKDNDIDEITAQVDGCVIRGWSYSTEDGRRLKMLMAREFTEGWYMATAAAAPGVKPIGETTAERLGEVTT